jgi:hypothetical protein
MGARDGEGVRRQIVERNVQAQGSKQQAEDARLENKRENDN